MDVPIYGYFKRNPKYGLKNDYIINLKLLGSLYTYHDAKSINDYAHYGDIYEYYHDMLKLNYMKNKSDDYANCEIPIEFIQVLAPVCLEFDGNIDRTEYASLKLTCYDNKIYQIYQFSNIIFPEYIPAELLAFVKEGYHSHLTIICYGTWEKYGDDEDLFYFLPNEINGYNLYRSHFKMLEDGNNGFNGSDWESLVRITLECDIKWDNISNGYGLFENALRYKCHMLYK